MARSSRSPPTPTGCCSPPRCCPAACARCWACSAELLTGAAYPADPVEGERDRLAERIVIARSQPGVIARTALAARRYGSHPTPSSCPIPTLVAAVRRRAAAPAPRAGRALGQQPRLVGDLDPGRPPTRWPSGAGRLDRARGRRRGAAGPASCSVPGVGWSTGPAPCSPTSGSAARRPPHRPRPGRAPAGQHGLRRLLLLAVRREHPRAAGLQLQPAQLVDHQAAGSSFLVEADVATEVTGPALLET